MLVQQFFSVNQYAAFINENFIPFYANTDEEWGEALEDQYEIGGGPSTAIVQSDGSLYDILTSYRENPDRYLERVQDALIGKNTYASIKAEYDKNPNDLKSAYALVNKHFEMWQSDKAAEYSRKILECSDEAKAIDVPYRETTINLYEAARFAVALDELFELGSPDGLETFRTEFPKSILTENVYGQLARAYLRLPLSDQGDAFFADLKDRFPENPSMLVRLVQYYSRKGENLDEGEVFARKLIELDPESAWYRQTATDLFLKNDKSDKAISIYGADFIEKHMDNTGPMNSYAWHWAIRGENLDHALVVIQKAFELNPEDSNLLDTMSMVYWKMKNYEKAIEVEKKAYQMNPLPDYQERIKQIKEDMEKVGN